VNTAAMRWTMLATKAPAHRQRVNRPIAALQVIATTFVMNAMVGRRSRQLKMPRPDAYTSAPGRYGELSIVLRVF